MIRVIASGLVMISMGGCLQIPSTANPSGSAVFCDDIFGSAERLDCIERARQEEFIRDSWRRADEEKARQEAGEAAAADASDICRNLSDPDSRAACEADVIRDRLERSSNQD